MLPLERDTARGRSRLVGWVKRFAMGSSTEEGDAGAELFIVTSWAGSRDKSSVGASDGWAEGRCWVGVSGDSDMSSGGAWIGGGDGLGWAG